MEPNQNTNTVQNTAGASTVANVSSASSTPLTASDASVGSSKSGSNVVFQDKPKKNMGLILTIVLLVLLAAGGIGFGVWAMMDGSSQVAKKDEQIAALKAQIDSLEEQIEVSSEKSNTDNSSNDDTGTVEQDRFIDVDEWGYKISLPEDLVISSQKYEENDDGSSSLCVWGYSMREGKGTPSFAEKEDPFVCVSRYPENTSFYGHLVFTEDGYDYLFNSTQTYLSDEGDMEGMDWEDETKILMSQSLGQKESYLKM